MDPITRFFDMPELVAHLTQYLDCPGVSRLMQTSRRLHALCTPSHYYEVSASYKPQEANLFDTTESIQAFAKNVHRVRQMTFGRHDVVYYVNCVIAFLDTLTTQQKAFTTITTIKNQPAISQPVWLAPADPNYCTGLPIPPMTMLTKLDFHFGEYYEPCPYSLPSYRDPKVIITQICWIMDSNPHLLDLSINGPTIKDRRDAYILIRSISGLQRLQTLSVEMTQWLTDTVVVPGVLIDIFFACSSTLQKLNLVSHEEDETSNLELTQEYVFLPPGTLQAWEKNDEECGLLTTYPRQQEPLQHLKQLSLGHWDEGMMEEDLRSILQHCPNLTGLVMPYIAEIKDVRGLAEDIVQWCPKLSNLSNYGFSGGGDAIRQLMMWMLKALPPQQVTHFVSTGIPRFNAHGLDDFGTIFRQHTSMLQVILLNNCHNIDSKGVQAILVECEALEELTVVWSMNDDRQRPYLNLDDAIEFSWACTRMQDLRLTVAIPNQPLHRPANGVVPYYNRPSPTTLSQDETIQFKKLESFYRQLGTLAQLERLNLRAIYLDPAGNREASCDFMVNTFPGLFSLGRSESGRLGNLQLLGGLSQLKGLSGSTCLMTEETEVTVGMDEVQWMDKHWPALKTANFSMNRIYNDPLRWLVEAREQKGQDINLY
ncbi:hypothetical protein BGZ96_012068 [Linnemannia gamsii]|uniref:F-box domain-containing protein n=1 Tax=Linnemannia gamsii TaxID=64522 RepID=A0ABQ7KBP2_9FUNG|nr:hypothetical protein BGZ96_012068 [Linnemannia gamsii]